MFKSIEFRSEVEDLVRFVEETDPDDIVEKTIGKLRNGVTGDELLTANALAVVRSNDVPPSHHAAVRCIRSAAFTRCTALQNAFPENCPCSPSFSIRRCATTMCIRRTWDPTSCRRSSRCRHLQRRWSQASDPTTSRPASIFRARKRTHRDWRYQGGVHALHQGDGGTARGTVLPVAPRTAVTRRNARSAAAARGQPQQLGRPLLPVSGVHLPDPRLSWLGMGRMCCCAPPCATRRG